MKTIRGTLSDLRTKHLPLWSSSREDVLFFWSESDFQEKRICTCGQSHVDTDWEMEEYVDQAYLLIGESGRNPIALHVPPERIDAFWEWAIEIDPDGVQGGSFWGAEVVINADLGSDLLRIRSVNKVGTPLREVEFRVPWEE